jgi:hypothetical protein
MSLKKKVAQHTYEIIGCLKVFPDSPEFFFLSLSLVKCKDLWWEKDERKFHIFGLVGQRLFFPWKRTFSVCSNEASLLRTLAGHVKSDEIGVTGTNKPSARRK